MLHWILSKAQLLIFNQDCPLKNIWLCSDFFSFGPLFILTLDFKMNGWVWWWKATKHNSIEQLFQNFQSKLETSAYLIQPAIGWFDWIINSVNMCCSLKPKDTSSLKLYCHCTPSTTPSRKHSSLCVHKGESGVSGWCLCEPKLGYQSQ